MYRPVDDEEADLTFLPRMHGSWKLSTSQVASVVRQTLPGSAVEVGFRMVGGRSYVRVASKGSVFGADCWANVDTAGRIMSAEDLAGRQFGIPAALNAFLRYRSEGQSSAGTTSLYDVLGAIGFQKLANTEVKALRTSWVPISFELQAGRLARAFVFPHDLTEALRPLSTVPELAKFRSVIAATPLQFWGIDYRDFGGPVEIRPPRASKLVDLTDRSSRCRDTR